MIYTKKLMTQLFGWGFLFIIVLISIEFLSFISLRYMLPKANAKYLLYSVPSLPKKNEYENYLKIRDPILGWPKLTSISEGKRDLTGSRPVPNFPEPGNECLSLYGDSYVFGKEVNNHEAWGNLLSQLTSCRISNFGVSAYGTDQALLRFKNNVKDLAPVTVLGIYPSNFKRNLNQNRYYIDGIQSNIFLFKPRYILSESGNLQHISLPTIPHEKLTNFIKSPDSFLRNELFIPGSAYGPIPLKFPYTGKIVSVLQRPEVWNWLHGQPDWHHFVQSEQPSQGLEIAVAIVKNFMSICELRDKECFILIFPSRNAYNYYTKTGNMGLQPFLDSLEQLHIPYLHLTPNLTIQLKGESICKILSHPQNCYGHFGPRGNKFVAETVFAFLKNNYPMTIREIVK